MLEDLVKWVVTWFIVGLVGGLLIINSRVLYERMVIVAQTRQAEREQYTLEMEIARLDYDAECMARERAHELQDRLGIIEEPVQLWELGDDTMVWLIRTDYVPELTAFIRIVRDTSFSEVYERKCKVKGGQTWFTLNGNEYYLKQRRKSA
jgi:hypothetical protein